MEYITFLGSTHRQILDSCLWLLWIVGIIVAICLCLYLVYKIFIKE
jgi:tellurite resistance protein TehA-like permease